MKKINQSDKKIEEIIIKSDNIKSKNMFTKRYLFIIIVFVALSSLLIVFFTPVMNFWEKIFAPTAPLEWYAVHLNNGQVYFGHIESVTPETITLKDTYLLEASQVQSGVFNLMKRGERNTMMLTDNVLFINRAAVLFWEKLTEDSEVVKGIKRTEGK